MADEYTIEVIGVVTEDGDLQLENRADYNPDIYDLTIYPLNSYRVSFDVAGAGIPPRTQVIVEGRTATNPGDPGIEYYYFYGWYTDNTYTTLFDFTTPIYSDTIVYGKMEEYPKYTISYISDHGITPQSKTEHLTYKLVSDDLISQNDDEYHFYGWFYDSEFTIEAQVGDELVSDIHLIAKWVKKPVITYESSHGVTPQSKIVDFGYSLTTSDVQYLEEFGYRFDGWFYDSEFTTQAQVGDTVNSDIHLTAKWHEYSVFNISYESDYGITPQSKSVLEGYHLTEEDLYQDEEIYPYAFRGWFYDSEFESEAHAGDEVTSDIHLVAKWQKMFLTVHYDTMGLSNPPAPNERIRIGSLIDMPDDPTSVGYEFLGWFKDSEHTVPWLFGTDRVYEDTVLYAAWSKTREEIDINWHESMQQTFEFYRVDPATWNDAEQLFNFESATINRDKNSDTLGSGTFDCLSDMNECYVRVYLIAIQNGIRHSICLGTLLVQTPAEKFNGRKHVITMDGYTSLNELKRDMPSIGYCLRKDRDGLTNIMDLGYRLTVEHLRAPVVKAYSDKELHDHFLASIDDTWYSFINDLIANAGFQFDVDEYGRILYEQPQSVEELQPRWIYTTDNITSILQPEINNERDLYNVPNVVEVLYSNDNASAYARVENNDDSSPISVKNRGMVVLHRDTNPSISGSFNSQEALQEYIEAYATQLLKKLSTVEHKITYTHGYCPVRVGDGVMIDYPQAGYDHVKAKVISQTITCKTGCQVEETAVYTTNLWR